MLPTSSPRCLDGRSGTAVPHENLADLAHLEVPLERADVIDDEADLPERAVHPLSQLDQDALDCHTVDRLLLPRDQLSPEK